MINLAPRSLEGEAEREILPSALGHGHSKGHDCFFLYLFCLFLLMMITCHLNSSIIVIRQCPCIFKVFFLIFQIMVNVMHARPRYDFSADYFVKIYRAECVCLRLHCNLIKSILDKQVCTDFAWNIWNDKVKT